MHFLYSATHSLLLAIEELRGEDPKLMTVVFKNGLIGLYSPERGWEFWYSTMQWCCTPSHELAPKPCPIDPTIMIVTIRQKFVSEREAERYANGIIKPSCLNFDYLKHTG